MKIILDTSVIIAFLLSRGKNNLTEIVKLAKQKKINLIVCKETFSELQTSLHAEKIKKLANYKSNVIAKFIAWYKYNASFMPSNLTAISKLSRDLKDNIFIQLVLLSNANYLVTSDKDLLVLKNIGKTKIRTPKDFIKENKLLTFTPKQWI